MVWYRNSKIYGRLLLQKWPKKGDYETLKGTYAGDGNKKPFLR